MTQHEPTWLQYNSPLGPLQLAFQGPVLRVVQLSHPLNELPRADSDPRGRRAAVQLDEYFGGQRTAFDLPFEVRGTAFQRKVWDLLQKISYGTTQTYKEVARQLGRTGAARAVGQACHTNPLLLVIPCHRVIAASGCGGFAPGRSVKKQLLHHEHRYAREFISN